MSWMAKTKCRGRRSASATSVTVISPQRRVSAAAEAAVLGGVAGALAREEEPHRLALHRPVVGVDDPLGEGAEQLLLA